ncbi:MAG TPA: cytochrome P460 family protein [Steroidobacteraceae bacterium]|nr:cytochrome P460 family protein [Steroidobacteraceae bacterium]
MQVFRIPLYAATALCLVIGTAVSIRAQEPAYVPFPENYRSWQLVKSIVVGPDCALFSKRGGIHHYYANSEAVEGYKTGKFPAGSIIVDEAMWMKDGEGVAKGIWLENGRRFLEVMRRDPNAYKDMDGWGYERFDGEDRVGKLGPGGQDHCHSCHVNAKDHDLVFSRMRP